MSEEELMEREGNKKEKEPWLCITFHVLFLWWEHTFMPASQNTNAKEICKPIRGS